MTPLPVNRFPNKLAPNVPDKIPINQHFCYFASFLIVLLTPFISTQDYLRDLNVLIISFTSSFEIISALMPEPILF